MILQFIRLELIKKMTNTNFAPAVTLSYSMLNKCYEKGDGSTTGFTINSGRAVT